MLSEVEIKKIIDDKKINSIYLQFTDMSGKLKSINLPASQIDAILNNQISFDGV